MNPAVIKLAVGIAISVVTVIGGVILKRKFFALEKPHGEGQPAEDKANLSQCCACDQPVEDRPADSKRRRYVLPACGHVYHWTCLEKLIKTTKRCAICKRLIRCDW